MNKVEVFENERATGYNQFVETWIPNYHYFLDRLPKLLSDTDQKDLLVVGCGTGNEIERFVKAPEQWTITGIDPSPEMIKQAKDKLHFYNKVSLIEGLVSKLDMEKKYSAATLLLVLHFLDDKGNKLNLLKDIADRLVSGATFVILDITGDKKQIQQNLKVLKLLLPEGLDEEQINNRLNRIGNELFTVSEQRLSELLQEAGFEAPLRFFQSSIYMGWLTKKK
ncbi:class I SAM-dependent methyltransferase [Croceimicrobium sp.]|uniref:class I SAM-dependent methyltransferase n=1 Tax=Croceimicrobium sp. TaxID=2828340 RepID=UPI003BACC8A5